MAIFGIDPNTYFLTVDEFSSIQEISSIYADKVEGNCKQEIKIELEAKTSDTCETGIKKQSERVTIKKKIKFKKPRKVDVQSMKTTFLSNVVGGITCSKCTRV